MKIGATSNQTTSIRPMVLTIIQRNNEILVSKGQNLINGEPHYRPLGGRIEFGEKSHETVAREMMEEISAEVENIEFLEVIEALFHSQDGTPRHHIIFLYRADFVDKLNYNIADFEIKEDYFTERVVAEWKPIEPFKNGKAILHPKAILKYL